jgi:hypothetical protein
VINEQEPPLFMTDRGFLHVKLTRSEERGEEEKESKNLVQKVGHHLAANLHKPRYIRVRKSGISPQLQPCLSHTWCGQDSLRVSAMI